MRPVQPVLASGVIFLVLGVENKLNAAPPYTFRNLATFSMHEFPFGGLTLDAGGNLFGTTYFGGSGNQGSVYRLNAQTNYSLSTIVSFNGTNGANPNASMIADSAGNLYGTTY